MNVDALSLAEQAHDTFDFPKNKSIFKYGQDEKYSDLSRLLVNF